MQRLPVLLAPTAVLLLLLLLVSAVGAPEGDAPAAPGEPADGYKASLIAQYRFYATATGSFAPVYPALAQQIVQDYGITEGICVDLGGGCGSLSMALARITNLRIYMLDIDSAAVRLCGILVDEAKLTGRVLPIEGDATDLPFRDNFADIVVSRGSIFFWPSQIAGVKEAYRILKPGGVAYIGGGFSRIIDPEILSALKESRRKAQTKGGGQSSRKPFEKDIVQQIQAAGISQVRMLKEPDNDPEYGWWLEIRK